jgi:hypothetical protein
VRRRFGFGDWHNAQINEVLECSFKFTDNGTGIDYVIIYVSYEFCNYAVVFAEGINMIASVSAHIAVTIQVQITTTFAAVYAVTVEVIGQMFLLACQYHGDLA